MRIINLFLYICVAIGFSNSLPATNLKAVEEEITVNGKTARVFNIIREDGKEGLERVEGEAFNVVLENRTSQPTCIHWHGLILPNNQDGVPNVTQAPIPPGKSYTYNFRIVQSGSYWMHSHYRFQEQQLMSAPLIIFKNEDERRSQKSVVVFLEDFTFQDPAAIFEALRKDSAAKNIAGMEKKTDLNDVKYDAYLTNRHTLSNPDIVAVNPNESIRLRVINGSASSNFFIKLGTLKGTAIAVDGEPIEPLENNVFELATAQRMDIMLTIPQEGAFPILAQGEGTNMQTGLILATRKASIPKLEEKIEKTAGALSYKQEKMFSARNPLFKRVVDRSLTVDLNGDMSKYIWMLNNQVWPNIVPLSVRAGERVEIVFNNKTGMAHPMHLHGHFFQVVEIEGENLSGAKRDTILILPKSQVKVQFDADNPGNWVLHCHNLYHLHAGMMTMINYEGFPLPKYTKEEQLQVN